MIPKIKEFEENEIDKALAYYKAIATKLSEISKQQPTIWYQITLCQGSFGNKIGISINTGHSKNGTK